MMPLEDMLTTAFREKAADIQPGTVPPLQRAPSALRPVPGPRGPQRWLAPAASAALVLAIIAGAVLVSRGVTGTQTPESGPAGIPRYYVALTGPHPHYPGSTTAAVRATATGAVLAQVTPPRPHSHFLAVAGAADDRTFVLAAQPWAPQTNGKKYDRLYRNDPQQLNRDLSPAIRFYVLHIGPTGRAVPLQALPALDIPAGHGLLGMALSPDGTQLAVNVTPNPAFIFRSNRSGLQVLDLVTGAHRSWSNPGFIGPGYAYGAPAAVGSLGWTADGRTISFMSGYGYHNVIRLLNVHAPGSSLLANSRVVPAVRIWKQDWRAGFITADGKTIVGIREYTATEPAGNFDNYEDLLRLSAATGGGQTVLNHLIYASNSLEQVLWASSSGRTVIVTGARLGATAGIVHGHRYTRIPWSASILTAAW